tara:strand:+ start:79 stop:315 length:237 start_codon:yes stop_codon:yes gene_type:complete
MEQSIFITAGMVSFVYLIIKYLEMKFILKEVRPMKLLMRDTIIVYLSVVSGSFVVDQFNGTTSIMKKVPEIFTNEPAF